MSRPRQVAAQRGAHRVRLVVSVACVLMIGCTTLLGCTKAKLVSRFLVASMRQQPDRQLKHEVTEPYLPQARLAATWVGHATVLVQIDDKFVLTDPVFTQSVGMVAKRYVPPGIAPENLPPIDVVLISHMHMDHLSLGSLDMIADRVEHIVVPKGGVAYLPNSHVPPIEVRAGESVEIEGLVITAAPVEHNGWRYGIDQAWRTTAFTGYVVEHRDLSFYFGGDSASSPWMFHAVGRRFPNLELALLPIAPIHPREYMKKTHMDPVAALDAFDDLGARVMMPIHYDTFFNSLDEYGEAPRKLRQEAAKREIPSERVQVFEHGERRVFVAR